MIEMKTFCLHLQIQLFTFSNTLSVTSNALSMIANALFVDVNSRTLARVL